VFALQPVLHALVSHWYGAQPVCAPALHVPEASQLPIAV
jgi:hypothetical protein